MTRLGFVSTSVKRARAARWISVRRLPGACGERFIPYPDLFSTRSSSSKPKSNRLTPLIPTHGPPTGTIYDRHGEIIAWENVPGLFPSSCSPRPADSLAGGGLPAWGGRSARQRRQSPRCCVRFQTARISLSVVPSASPRSRRFVETGGASGYSPAGRVIQAEPKRLYPARLCAVDPHLVLGDTWGK
jgi:hypothetical protein